MSDTLDDYTLANFTHECADCGKTLRVVDGRECRHWCRVPRRLRGRASQASAESMRWTCEQAGHPSQEPGDASCICGTWAPLIEAATSMEVVA